MTPEELDLARAGRADLLHEIARLRVVNGHLNDNLTTVQARCSELFVEVQDYRSGIPMPGWTCNQCGVFTGTLKGMTACRCCGEPRPK